MTAAAAAAKTRPSFDELKSDPYKNAWGIWGKDDQLGALNLLTPEVIKRATQEATNGITIGLNLPLGEPATPYNATRCKLTHKINAKGYANDDELHINTQSSSQWDGLRHFPYQETLKFYMGATQDDFTGAKASDLLGTNHMAQKGIVGRGVLLDFRAWADKNGIDFDPFTPYAISVAELDKVAADQGVAFLPGDILVIRTGLTANFRNLTFEQQEALGGGKHMAFAGVEQSEEMLRWHWDHAFAAVCGDTYAYEAWPAKPKDDGYKVKLNHEVFLSGWGMPIGELFDLEALSKKCAELNKYTFLLVAAPLNVTGGVASTSNTIALL